MLKRSVLVVLVCLFWAGVGHAQVVIGTPTSYLEWDQDMGPAEAMFYTYYPDGAAQGTVLTGVECSAVRPVTVCRAPFPAFTPGPHRITLTASNTAGEGPHSPPFLFTFTVLPAAPANLRIGAAK